VVKIIEIENVFEPEQRKEREEPAGKQIFDYVPKPTSYYVVSVNEKLISDFSEETNPGDTIIIVPIVRGGGGGKDVLRIGAFLALTIATGGLTSGLLGMSLATTKFALMMAGGLLINAILPPSQPDFGNVASGIDTSPTYGFTGAKTLPNPGAPLPILYGQMKLPGSVISQYIKNEGDDEYLYMLLALCEGEIEPISINDIEINGNPADTYDGVEFAYRTGTIDQDISQYDVTKAEKFHTGKVIGWFNNVTTANTFNVEVPYNIPTVRAMQGNANDAITVSVSFPSGLYAYSNGIQQSTVQLKIEYSSDGGATWNVHQRIIPEHSVIEYEWQGAGYYNLGAKAWGETEPSDAYMEPYKKTGRSRQKIIAEQVFDYWEITASQTSAVRREFTISGLSPDSYQVRITKLTPDKSGSAGVNTMYWAGATEKISDRLYYPIVALLGLKIKATGQLNGTAPNVGVICRRKPIKVYDENGTFIKEAETSNNAWAMWDFITNKRYGLGKDYSVVDYQAFDDWASWCDERVPLPDGTYEPRCRFNGVFDYKTDAWSIMQSIAQVGRAAPILMGTKYSVIVDKPKPTTQQFGMGNIVKGSYKTSYTGVVDLSKEIAARYIDESIGYNETAISVQLDDGGNPTEMALIGVTKQSYAIRHCRYILQTTDKQRRVTTFAAGIDSIACKVGDVIEFSYDAPAWGHSGRLVSATTTQVTLDQDIFFDPAKTYNLKVRHEDDTIETVSVTNPGTETDTITVSAFATAPKPYETYQLGEVGKENIKLRVADMTSKDDLSATITAVDYNESILDDWSTPEDIARPSYITGFAKIYDISIGEHLEKRKDGTIVPFLDFSWRVEDDRFSIVDILISSDNGATWSEIATGIRTGLYRLNALSLAEGQEYTFAFVSNDFSGSQGVEEAAKKTHIYLGKSAPPEDVQSFTYSITSNGVLLSWDKNTDVDLSGYNLYLDGTQIEHSLKATTYLYADLTLGLHTFGIKAVDTSGNESVNMTETTIDMIGAKITSIRADVIDNNVLLFWTSEKGTIDISNYIVRKDGAIAGTKKGTFTTLLETEAGTYTYCVTPIDIFGNEGSGKCVTVNVASPPDYVLNKNWSSDFSGTKTNCMVENGDLVLMIDNVETWEQHFTSRGWDSPQDQIDAGYPLYAEPFAATASYEETFDYEAILPSSRVTVTITKEVVQGSLSENCTISVSTDGTTWTDYSGYSVYATNFRYVKIKLDYSGTNASSIITDLNVKLDAKKKRISGMIQCNAADAGGTALDITGEFSDVTSITGTPQGTTAANVVIDFNDVPNPTTVNFLVFDNNGNRLDRQISYSIEGY